MCPRSTIPSLLYPHTYTCEIIKSSSGYPTLTPPFIFLSGRVLTSHGMTSSDISLFSFYFKTQPPIQVKTVPSLSLFPLFLSNSCSVKNAQHRTEFGDAKHLGHSDSGPLPDWGSRSATTIKVAQGYTVEMPGLDLWSHRPTGPTTIKCQSGPSSLIHVSFWSIY